jgi:NADH pyrophosphatase NudC (nudix superfamily)
MKEFKFCPKCGGSFDKKTIDNHVRRICNGCDFVFYQNPKPTASVFIIRDQDVLLARRGIEPFKDWWDCIGGFIEEGESPQEAAARETKEETGLDIKLVKILGADKELYAGIPIVPIAFLAEIVGGTPKPSDDVSELKWFHLGSLPKNIAFEGNKKVLDLLKIQFLKADKQ